MKTAKNNKRLAPFSMIALLLYSTANAKIYLDYEVDPLPLVKIEVLLPSTRLTKNDVENLGLRFLEESFDSGTQKLSKQKYQDALASFGASVEISTGYEYADISSTFPLNGGSIPKGLSELIKDAWENPRLTKVNFARSQKYLKANHLALLDRDSTLLNLGLQKIISKRLFGLTPYSTDTFSRIKLEDVVALHKGFYSKNGDIWVGVIGPENLKKEVSKTLQDIFPLSGAVIEGSLKEPLKSGYVPEHKGSLNPTFLLIDKKDLAQIHYGFLRVNQKTQEPKNELTDKFTYNVLSGAGLDSVYGKKIREERGISYVVAGIMENFYNYPILSLYANPQRNKQAEAFEVLQGIIKDTFESGKSIQQISKSTWAGWLLSYRNSERQSGATPEGRLNRRKSVVTGDLSYALFNTPVDEWSIKKYAATQRLKEFSANSSLLVGAIGDASEMEPLIKKYFPTLEVLKINFKDVLDDAWIKKKP